MISFKIKIGLIFVLWNTHILSMSGGAQHVKKLPEPIDIEEVEKSFTATGVAPSLVKKYKQLRAEMIKDLFANSQDVCSKEINEIAEGMQDLTAN